MNFIDCNKKFKVGIWHFITEKKETSYQKNIPDLILVCSCYRWIHTHDNTILCNIFIFQAKLAQKHHLLNIITCGMQFSLNKFPVDISFPCCNVWYWSKNKNQSKMNCNNRRKLTRHLDIGSSTIVTKTPTYSMLLLNSCKQLALSSVTKLRACKSKQSIGCR